MASCKQPYVSPRSPSGKAKVVSVLSGAPVLPGTTLDVYSILDSLDSTTTAAATAPSSTARQSQAASSTTATAPAFDPIAFLNKHYETEATLTAQLPALREAVSERMEMLDDRISNALQRQSETAAATRKSVQDAKSSVRELESRIFQIKEKASLSERAVLEITKDMKRLDCAKKHLQRTITTLKRLHMLVHAVEQLRLASFQRPFPDYKTAANLIEATRLLLGHFSAYTQKVQPMRVLSLKVKGYQETLRVELVRGFRMVAFGPVKVVAMEKSSSRAAGTVATEGSETETEEAVVSGPIMSTEIMQGWFSYEHVVGSLSCLDSCLTHFLVVLTCVSVGGVLFMDALGEQARVQFIHEFCQDQLGDYLREFEPRSREAPKHERRVSSFKVVEAPTEPVKSMASLDQIEKRFAWFRDLLTGVNVKFKDVFPYPWNLQAIMASMFLQLVSA